MSTAVIEWWDSSTFFFQKTFQCFFIFLYLTTFQKVDIFPHILFQLFPAHIFNQVIGKLETHATRKMQNQIFLMKSIPNWSFHFQLMHLCFDIPNDFRRCFPDGIHRCPECFHILVLTPTGNIGKRVFGSIQTKVVADNIGDTFCFYFFGCPVF